MFCTNIGNNLEIVKTNHGPTIGFLPRGKHGEFL